MSNDITPAELELSAGPSSSRSCISLGFTPSELSSMCGHRPPTSPLASPLRHHTRNHTAPRQVKETLNARSKYTNSEDDGVPEHRINQYLIKQEIGRGSFGAVHMAVDQYGCEFAVKEFSKSRLRKRAKSHVLRNAHGARRPGVLPARGLNLPIHLHSSGQEDEEGGNPLYLIKEEIAIMKKLHHDNLVALYEVLDDPTEDSLYMVMEMCQKGVIMKVGLGVGSDPYDDEHCRCWFRDLILGIEYLHAQGIVHRDIKPDNCLLTKDDVLKVVDFGVSEMFEKNSDMFTAKSVGSPAFLPPELCVAKHGDISGKAADIWSMGVTLYCLRYGRIPFEKDSIFELYEAIRTEEVTCGDENDEDFKDLVFKILEKDPTKRIAMPELRAHPWVTKRGIDPLLSAEENTAEIVGPVTEEEVNTAITKNMGHVLAVVKAVQKFKRLIEPTGSVQMESILGQDIEAHFVQPPLPISQTHPQGRGHSIENESLGPDGPSEGEPEEREDIFDTTLNSRPQELGSQIRGDAVAMQQPISRNATNTDGEASRYNLTCTPRSPSPPLSSRADTPSKQSFSEGTRGHARSPLDEEHLYLFIGPSTFTGPLTDTSSYSEIGSGSNSATDADNPAEDVPAIHVNSIPIVSESPSATDINIYETAYREEIERIRRRSRELRSPAPKVYLTRRVEGKTPSLAVLLEQVKAAEEPLDKDSSTEIRNAAEDDEIATAEAEQEKQPRKMMATVSCPGKSETKDSAEDIDANQPPSTPLPPPQPLPAQSPFITTKISTAASATTATTMAKTPTATMSTYVAEKPKTGLWSLFGRGGKDRAPSDKE